ncbi:MAG: glycosyltransferase family 2 protein [Pseudomonadales bacterium]|jgi:glycosyltransferase involved in cell wall biosynthesis|nr:glycosyltransferase family 2 protein [Pseudomonadales bacterium]
MKAIKSIVVIPAYNEAKILGKVVAEVKKYADMVVVIDDASIDNTAQIAKRASAKVISHSINLGQGAALQTGFDYAKTLKPKVVITYDADGQFLAKELPKVMAPILKGEVDIVFGSRFLNNKSKVPLPRKLLLKSAIVFTKFFSDLSLTDTHNGFRALSPLALEKINIKLDRMAHASEIINQTSYFNLRYKEVPVTVLYTKYSISKGQKSINLFSIIGDLLSSRFS